MLAVIEEAGTKRRNANQVWKKQILDLIAWSGEREAERGLQIAVKHGSGAQFAEYPRKRKAGATR